MVGLLGMCEWVCECISLYVCVNAGLRNTAHLTVMSGSVYDVNRLFVYRKMRLFPTSRLLSCHSNSV